MRASPELVRCGVQGCMVAEAPKGYWVRREARFPSPVRNVTCGFEPRSEGKMGHANGRPEDNTDGACCWETPFESEVVHKNGEMAESGLSYLLRT